MTAPSAGSGDAGLDAVFRDGTDAGTGTGPDARPGAEPDHAAGDAVPPFDPVRLVAQMERRLLGGERTHTRAEVAAAAGIGAQEARDLWQALGFAAVDDGERAFTDADIDALRRVRELSGDIELGAEQLRAMTRMLGRSFSRLASWQGQLVLEVLAESPELLSSEDDLLTMLDTLLHRLESLQTYVWRRQLAAYLSRLTPGVASAQNASTMTVGFVDMAQFTSLTRRSSESDLRAVLEAFETLATDVVGAHHGQVVKTIGDEVLYVADDVLAGADIALDLVAAAEMSEVLPQVRAGVACGPVVSRLGDVYGQTVNIASRLTSVARAGSVLVDENLADALRADERYSLRSLRPTSVRGYQHLKSWRLRRT